VDEVPEALKRQLLRSTNGLNSATIVIADRQGRKEIAKAIRSLPAPASAPRTPPALLGGHVPQLIGAVALGAALALVWLILR
jgi:hypothetical protein